MILLVDSTIPSPIIWPNTWELLQRLRSCEMMMSACMSRRKRQMPLSSPQVQAGQQMLGKWKP